MFLLRDSETDDLIELKAINMELLTGGDHDRTKNRALQVLPVVPYKALERILRLCMDITGGA